MKKVIFIIVPFFLSSLPLILASVLDDPYDYQHSLPDHLQHRLIHCSSLPHDAKLLCLLETTIDAQGLNDDNKTHPPQTPPSTQVCEFKVDHVYARYPYAMAPSPRLNRVLEKYVAMHIRCNDLGFAGQLDDMDPGSSQRSCRYLLWRPSGDGLGNRILSLVSSFLYAILSARVLLIDFPEWGDLFCEPFPGSTVQVPENSRWFGRRYFEFRDNHCGVGNSDLRPGVCNGTRVHFVLDHTAPQREYDSVSCPTGYARLRNVPSLLAVSGNQYFVPGLYANPLLSPLLDVLFPQRNPFHLLSRYILNPIDDIWISIRSNVDFDASRRFGVQIRDFSSYKSEYDANIMRCLSRIGCMVPKRFQKMTRPVRGHVSVYVTTLNKQHVETVNKTISGVEEESGKRFRIQWQEVDVEEKHDSKHMQEALIDMWVLSMSHVLITSRESTFDYVAVGLSGAYPYFIDVEEGGSCKIGMGVEPCFHAAPKHLRCDQDEQFPQDLHERVLYNYSMVKDCLDRPELGWTIVSDML